MNVWELVAGVYVGIGIWFAVLFLRGDLRARRRKDGDVVQGWELGVLAFAVVFLWWLVLVLARPVGDEQ